MSLPLYDAEKHHVGLGAGPGSEVGLTISGAYRKLFRREASDELAGVHYGSDSLFNQPGVSTWTQDDFTGGGWQQVWGKDQAMFSSCYNFLPSQFDRSLRTVIPMTLRAATGVGGGLYTGKPLAMFVHQGWVVTVWRDRLYRYEVGTGNAVEVFLEQPISGRVYDHAIYDRRLGLIVATTISNISGGTAFVLLNPLTGLVAGGGGTVEPGELANAPCTGLDCDGDRMVVAAGNTVWTGKMGQRAVDAIATDWVRVGRLPAPWKASAWMSQQLYILCGTGEGQTSLVTFDGVQLLPVTDFAFNFYGQSICAYAGRLYVGGAGLDISGGTAFAELHEVTGASVRLVKTFASELHSGGRYALPTSIESLCVHEGLLFFGDTGRGMIAYDVTTDSLYGAMQFDPGRANATRAVRSLLSARGRLWAYCGHPSFEFDNGLWANVVSGDGGPLGSFVGQLITSEFGPELDRMKRWKKFRLLTRGDSDRPQLEVSVNGGQSYVAAPLYSSENAGVSTLHTFDLSNIPTSHSVRFQITLPRYGAPGAGYAELVAFSAAFQLVDSDAVHEDGTEKLAWSFAVAGVETVQLEDGTIEIQQLGKLRDQLWEWGRSRKELSFVDQDGTRYTVEVDSISETQPVVLPPVDYDDPHGRVGDYGREAFYQLSLVEA